MKSFIAVVLLISTMSAFAGYLEDVSEDICKNIKINRDGNYATCTASNASAVLAAKAGQKVSTELSFDTYDAVTLGVIPDADTNTIFFYTKWLVDASGKKVGVLTINGYENYEMGIAERVDVCYNLKGEVVSIQLKSVR